MLAVVVRISSRDKTSCWCRRNRDKAACYQARPTTHSEGDSMDRLTFDNLWREGRLGLGLGDTSALGQGFTVNLKDVLFELHFIETRPYFLIMAELGTIAPEQ